MTPEELSLIRRIYEEALPMDGANQDPSSAANARNARIFRLRSIG